MINRKEEREEKGNMNRKKRLERRMKEGKYVGSVEEREMYEGMGK